MLSLVHTANQLEGLNMAHSPVNTLGQGDKTIE